MGLPRLVGLSAAGAARAADAGGPAAVRPTTAPLATTVAATSLAAAQHATTRLSTARAAASVTGVSPTFLSAGVRVVDFAGEDGVAEPSAASGRSSVLIEARSLVPSIRSDPATTKSKTRGRA